MGQERKVDLLGHSIQGFVDGFLPPLISQMRHPYHAQVTVPHGVDRGFSYDPIRGIPTHADQEREGLVSCDLPPR
jgi:hypothetical protein